MKLLVADKKVFKEYIDKVAKGDITKFDFCLYNNDFDIANKKPIFGKVFETDDMENESWYGVKQYTELDGDTILCGYWGGGYLISYEPDYSDIQQFLDDLFNYLYVKYVFIEIENGVEK